MYVMGNGKCQNCTRFIDGHALTAEYDHVTALINGGKNCESNLQLLCNECHRQKTGTDVAEKSRVYRRQLTHLGLKPKKGRPMPGSRASGLKKLMNGQVVQRS
jgi:5-methylcytosine-specific restriction endonuclease McrA